jgi:predicted metal-dependent HD superfamily phosphohydrolase
MQVQAFLTRHQTAWNNSWQALGLRPPAASLLDALTTCYSEPHRCYHTLEHLDACLRHLDNMRESALHLQEVALALWFHDALYTVGATDNEQRSADWAGAELQAAGAPQAMTDRVHALVMVTRHDQPPRSPDEALLLDVDLAILGAPATVFDAYEQQIFREYQCVPPAAFRSNRMRILQGFQDRERIYHTPRFRDQRESQARTNLARSIRALAR